MNLSNLDALPLDHRCNAILFQEPGIWAIEKATGVLSHPNRHINKEKNIRTLLNAEYHFDDECYRWNDVSGKTQKLYLTHRLDSPTSGVLIATNNKALAIQIKDLFYKREIEKTYYAIVRPKGNIKEGIWKDHLVEKRQNGNVRVTRGNGQVAVTNVSIERKKTGLYGLTMLRLRPKTGRTHQLRVQCALRGISIIGDKTYGDFTYNRKISKASKVDRLCLHAGEIEFELNSPAANLKFYADSPLPRSMGKLLLS